jgi:hypothetical protein
MKQQSNLLLELMGRLQGIADAPSYGAKKLDVNNLVSTLQNFVKNIDKSPVKEQRAAKGANGVASLGNGNVLMSDGSVKGPAAYQLKALIQNTIDQTAYTPAAIAEIQSLPIRAQQLPKHILGVNHQGSDGSNTIGISPNNFNQFYNKANISPEQKMAAQRYANTRAVEVLRHEINHALDSNIMHFNTPASGNSEGFYSILKKYENYSPNANNTISFLNNYPQETKILDRESFAQYGSGGQNVFRGASELSQPYKNIFVPESKKMNYSPIFSTDWEPYD